MRLNWGCGPVIAAGWLNGRSHHSVAMHALQDLPYLDLVPALVKLRRVLKVGGVLRVDVPDLERAIGVAAR